jgi:hypothetical protein
MDNSPEPVAVMVRECLAVESADGLEFSPNVIVEPIAIEDRYPGVRAVIKGTLAGARIRLQLDIGVGDVAVRGGCGQEFPRGGVARSAYAAPALCWAATP